MRLKKPYKTYSEWMAWRKKTHRNHAIRSIKQIQFLLDRQGSKCANPECGADISADNFHTDHIISIRRGGKNEKGNWELLCLKCNQWKKDKPLSQLPESWRKKILEWFQEDGEPVSASKHEEAKQKMPVYRTYAEYMEACGDMEEYEHHLTLHSWRCEK